MKKFKKGLSLILALVLLATTFSVAAQAASVADATFGYIVPTNNKYTSSATTVNLYGNYDYLNFAIDCYSDNTYFFYQIYSDKNYQNPVAVDYAYCDVGSYTWSPWVKLSGTFKTGTYYAIAFSAKIDSNDNIKFDDESFIEFKINVNRTTAFNKQMVILKDSVNTVNGPRIKWYNSVSNVSKFYIYRRSITGTKWTKVGTVNGKTFSFVDTSVKDKNCKYIYTVKAANSKGVYTRYHFGGETVLFARAPKVSASVTSDNRIKVTWNNTSKTACYRLYRITNTGDWKRIADLSPNTTYYYDKATNNTVYQYTVRAVISTDYGDAVSAYIEGEIFKFIGSPKLTGIDASTDDITVSWGAVTGATGYTVFRRPADLSKGWQSIITVSNDNLYYTDKTATADDSYIYTVRSEGGDIHGSYSSTGIKYVKPEVPEVPETPEVPAA
ncbi:MAG: hypothetical protein KIG53_00295 [Oscillospiraceae bacterium]|nr:hypothetical protein [Oscillospiraceae bacterium]